jgi:hypothetical protein
LAAAAPARTPAALYRCLTAAPLRTSLAAPSPASRTTGTWVSYIYFLFFNYFFYFWRTLFIACFGRAIGPISDIISFRVNFVFFTFS